MRRLSVLIAALLVVAAAAPANAEVTQAELQEARQKVNEKSAELEQQLGALDAVIALQADYQRRIAHIRDEISDRERLITLSEYAAKEQAIAMYLSAGSGTFQPVVVSPDAIASLGAKTAYLDAVVELDVDAVNQLIYLVEDRASLQDELTTLLAEQGEVAIQLETVTNELLAELEVVNAEYQALYSQWQVEEAERRRKAAEAAARARAAAAAAAAAAGNYASSAFVDPTGRTCPVAGANTFRDSWLEARDYRDGVHHGTDLIAAKGTPLVAMEAGVVYSMGYHWAGGNGLYLRGNSGDIYYYAHLNGYAAGMSPGTRVGVAQLVGYVGDSGAASVPHLHLGYRPGGGALVNPYQLLLKVCR
jgi:murein DD-endopeptidase MepM/ murein hydrolase activator NlpD